jgi:hypothetical protein
MGDISGTANLAVLFLIVSIAITWLVIYTAVRSAVGHALDRVQPRLIADATATPESVSFVVTNVGTGPAFYLSVRWPDEPAGEKLAQTLLLGVSGRLEWTLAAPAVAGEELVVRQLQADWSIDHEPNALQKSAKLAVLVPSRLDPPI